MKKFFTRAFFYALFFGAFLQNTITPSTTAPKPLQPLRPIPRPMTLPLTPPLTPPPAYSEFTIVKPTAPAQESNTENAQAKPNTSPEQDTQKMITLPSGKKMKLEIGTLLQAPKETIITNLNSILSLLKNIESDISSIAIWSRFRLPWYFRQNYIEEQIQPIRKRIPVVKEKIAELSDAEQLSKRLKEVLFEKVTSIEKKYFEVTEDTNLLLQDADDLFQEDDVFEKEFDIFEFQKEWQTVIKITETIKNVIATILQVGFSIQNIHTDSYMWCTVKRLGIPQLVMLCTKEATKNKARILFGEMKTIINRIEDKKLKDELALLLVKEIKKTKKYYSSLKPSTKKDLI